MQQKVGLGNFAVDARAAWRQRRFRRWPVATSPTGPWRRPRLGPRWLGGWPACGRPQRQPAASKTGPPQQLRSRKGGHMLITGYSADTRAPPVGLFTIPQGVEVPLGEGWRTALTGLRPKIELDRSALGYRWVRRGNFLAPPAPQTRQDAGAPHVQSASRTRSAAWLWCRFVQTHDERRRPGQHRPWRESPGQTRQRQIAGPEWASFRAAATRKSLMLQPWRSAARRTTARDSGATRASTRAVRMGFWAGMEMPHLISSL